MATNNTLTLISSATVGAGGAATINFTSIPQTYTDLVVKISSRDASAGEWNNLDFRISGISSSVYTAQTTYGVGNSTGVGIETNTSAGMRVYHQGNNTTANTFSNIEFYFPNYTSTSNNKTVSVDYVTENNATAAIAGMATILMADTTAITSLSFFARDASNFLQHSTAYLYGVASAAVGAKATGGDIISQDANYFYHTFLSSGTFTPIQSLTADYLVVAGGGGGGTQHGGGGGAGGLRSTVTATGGGGSLESTLSLTAQAYTVTVGAGGAGTPSGGNGTRPAGTNGSNSVFSTITSTGGGGGASYVSSGTQNGSNGGSGGGGGGSEVAGGLSQGGTGTTNQGYAGGNGTQQTTSRYVGGGGGGAGAVGQAGNVNSTTAGIGGVGVAVQMAIAGTLTYYAGGGGGAIFGSGTLYGGAGGAGGGGAGGSGVAGTAATANTGGGGGAGGAYTVAGGSGGSGIVIVRYAI